MEKEILVEKKKYNGAYYTPTFLADYLAKEMYRSKSDCDDVRLLDPAIGDGVLVKETLKYLKDKSFRSIVGLDIDNEALSASNENLSSFEDLPFSFLNEDALTPFGENHKMGWKKVRNTYCSGKKFNYIISNPPWGINIDDSKLPIIESSFKLASGQYDIYDLFVELIIDQLEEKGIYGLIIPDSIFNIEHEQLRKLLLEETKLLVIGRLGEKIFEGVNRACTIIIGKKERPAEDHSVKCFRLNKEQRNLLNNGKNKLDNIVAKHHYFIPQIRFLNNSRFNLNIDLKIDEEGIIKKIEDSEHVFSNYTTSTRGVELSKKGIVINCPNCKFSIPKPRKSEVECPNCDYAFEQEDAKKDRIIVNEMRNGIYKPIVVGEDISRYDVHLQRSIETNRKGINYKDLSIYSGPKILVRKTGVGITASIDYDESLTNQVVYIFKLNNESKNKVPLEVLLGLLNSRIYTFYLLKKNGENEWKSHPYITLTDIKNLPIPNLGKVEDTILVEIQDLVRDTIVNGYQVKNDIGIERRVLELLGLNRGDFKIVMDAISSCEQLIPFKRLLNIKTECIFEN